MMTATPQTRADLHDKTAEVAVIGSILIDPTAIDKVAAILKPQDFFIETCQWAYDAALALHDNGLTIDPLTLESELTRRGKWQQMNPLFLTDCESNTPSALNAASYAAIVKDFARRRHAVDISQALAKAAFSPNGAFEPELGLAALSLQTMAESLAPDDRAERFVIGWAAEALEPQPPIDWIIENLLSAGSVAILAGEGGTKKTWAMLDLAVCVALGVPWLEFSTRPGLVLIVDEESGKHRLKRRLGDALRGHSASDSTPVGFISLAGLNMREPKDIEQLHAAVIGNGARLVVIDALIDILGGGVDNAAEDIAPVFHSLRTIADEAQCAIIVVDHTNRLGDYRGSSAKKGACDLLLLVTSDKNSSHIEFTTAKARDIEPITFAGMANFFTDSFYMTATQATEKAEHFTKAQNYVLSYLKEHGASTAKDIMSHADTCVPETARRTIYQLVDRGKVRRIDSGGDEAIYGLVPE